MRSWYVYRIFIMSMCANRAWLTNWITFTLNFVETVIIYYHKIKIEVTLKQLCLKWNLKPLMYDYSYLSCLEPRLIKISFSPFFGVSVWLLINCPYSTISLYWEALSYLCNDVANLSLEVNSKQALIIKAHLIKVHKFALFPFPATFSL